MNCLRNESQNAILRATTLGVHFAARKTTSKQWMRQVSRAGGLHLVSMMRHDRSMTVWKWVSCPFLIYGLFFGFDDRNTARGDNATSSQLAASQTIGFSMRADGILAKEANLLIQKLKTSIVASAVGIERVRIDLPCRLLAKDSKQITSPSERPSRFSNQQDTVPPKSNLATHISKKYSDKSIRPLDRAHVESKTEAHSPKQQQEPYLSETLLQDFEKTLTKSPSKTLRDRPRQKTHGTTGQSVGQKAPKSIGEKSGKGRLVVNPIHQGQRSFGQTKLQPGPRGMGGATSNQMGTPKGVGGPGSKGAGSGSLRNTVDRARSSGAKRMDSTKRGAKRPK